MLRSSLQLGNVVEVDDTGKIISIPEINLNVDAANGRRSNDSSVAEPSHGTHLGDVAPWTEPPSPLTPPPTKRSFGIMNKVSLASLRSDPRYPKELGLSYANWSNAAESTSTLTSYMSSTSYSHSRTSSVEQSLRKSKSSFGLNNNSRPSVPGSSSPSSSGGVAKAMLSPLSGLIGMKSKSRSRSKTLENDGREHPSLRPMTPPLPEVPGAGSFSNIYSNSVHGSSSVTLSSVNGKKKEKPRKRNLKDKYKERDREAGDPAGVPPVPSLKDGRDMVIELDTNLDSMDGIVDSSFLTSSPANGTLIGKGSSISQSISDDKHSLHSHQSNSPSNHPYSSHLGPIQPSEFHNPFSASPLPLSAASPPRSSSLANLTQYDRKISPRTIVPSQGQQQNKDLNLVIPSHPMSKHGLHGGLAGTGAVDGLNGNANGVHSHAHPNSSGSPTTINDVSCDPEAPPPGSPTWIAPESWNVQPAASGDLEAEEEEYYSSSEDSLTHHGGIDAYKNKNYSPGGPVGTGATGGGRPIVFARHYSDDELNEADELGRRPAHHPRSLHSFRSSSTSASTGYPPTSRTGSLASVNSAFAHGMGKAKKESSRKRKKLMAPRKNSNPNNASALSSSSNDRMPSDYAYVDSATTTITTRSGSKLDINLGSLGYRRPSHPPSHLLQDSSSHSQQHLPLPLSLPASLSFLTSFPSRVHPGPHPAILPQEVVNTRPQEPPRLALRVYRPNGTYHIVQCAFHVTVAQLTPRLNAKLLLDEERETHKLYLKERGRERILAQTERPADIIRRRLEQAGYDGRNDLELLGEDGLNFLLKFIYKSEVFGPTEQSIPIENYERVDLSGHSLRTIPVALHQHADQITTLYLSRNPIVDLPLDFIQSSTELTELRLSQMGLKKVPANVRYAKSLTHLDLASNRIGDLDDAYLGDISGLRVLKVQNNRMEKLPWHFPKLRSLTTLIISNNKFRVLPAVVCQLENLRDLDISFNAISELSEDLGLLRNLEHLIMVGNLITFIPLTAASLVSLKRLDCRRNRIGDLTVIGMLPKLEHLSADHNSLHGIDLCLGPCLTTIDASYNEITEMRVVPGPIGQPGPFNALRSLDVSHAKLSSVSPLALSSLPSLRQLNLSHNNIKILPPTIGDLEHLEILSCADNTLEKLPPCIGRLKRLEFLDVHENNLTELPGELWACASLVKINATSNLIEKWSPPSAAPLIDDEDPLTPSSDLHVHPFSDERKGSTVSTINAINPSPSRLPSLAYALERLYLGENQLTAEALGFLSLFQELKVLNLSFNLIQDLPPTFFKNFLYNVDTPSPAQTPNQTHTSSLEELYLSGNKLTTLPTEDLARMTRLSTLFLNGNRLQTLPQELGKVKNLTILDVGSNLLKYNIYNWEFDWNWNFNKNLKYLNLSGNKRLQIKSNLSKLSGNLRHNRTNPTASAALERQQSLGGFTDLTQLRVLGLMDITITSTGQSVGIPDEHKDRRVRTSESTVCGMAYGIADTLGRNDHLNMLDLVHEFPRKNEAIFAMFGRSQPHKAMPAGISGNRIARFLRDKYIEVFQSLLPLQATRDRLEKDVIKDRLEEDVIKDALRRSFLKLNQNLHDVLFSNRTQTQGVSSNGNASGSNTDVHDAYVSRGGASGVVLYFRDKTMYIANTGNALAVISRGGNAEPVSRKHDPYDRQETSRIRAAEGWISPAGLVNDELDISRSFGFFHLHPVINARPDIHKWELSELDEFVIIANRGLWDFVSYKTAVDIARRERGDPMLAAQKLRDFAMSYGADGSTMIMVISVSDLFRKDEPRSREGSVVDPQIYKPVTPGTHKTAITDRGLRRLQDEVPPPTGHLALVFTDIRNSTHLWEVNRGMNTAWRLHNTLLRRKLRFCGGYEVKTEGDAFMCAFPTTMAAVWWGLAVQMELLEQEWPLEILECEDGKPIYDSNNKLIAQGLSVRMGIHCGAPLCEIDPVNHRMDYFGPMVNRSARINSSAAGGQIMCSEEVIREIKAKLQDGPPTAQSDSQPLEAVENIRRLGVSIIEVGEVKLKGLELPEQLSLIYPGHLVARHNLLETAEDPDSSGSRVKLSVSQLRQLGMICIRLESLATCRIFREMGERKGSMQSVDNDNDEEEDPLYIHGDPNLLLPPLDEKTSSDRDMSLVLDALSGRIENAVARIKETAQSGSIQDRLISGLKQKGDIDERTLQSILSIIEGL
ncbi:hypothetical protein D9757_005752 [Collybiopsis confluens]|uniref:Adenylate cyclase n=1 Tax=Collybiopsis confluens TaxID=2823264 RepID=A0A8H5HPY4_9AGAR|nr:hypothetical protein D9757_005752 [Collybiopsis confluens]